MIAITVEGSELRAFMNKLLAGSLFDCFVFRESLIVSFARFEAEGQTGQEGAKPPMWAEMRPYVFNMIKGREKPRTMRIILSWPDEGIADIAPNAKALFLNVNFESDSALITTGCSTHNFTLDKSDESNWDGFVCDFLAKNGIKPA